MTYIVSGGAINCTHTFICGSVVGGLAQWFGHRSLAGGLSLVYAWSMVDMWPILG